MGVGGRGAASGTVGGMRLIRFLSGGSEYVGAIDAAGVYENARVIREAILGDYTVTDEVVPVEQLLAPIVPTDLLCIGLNYRAHSGGDGQRGAGESDAVYQERQYAGRPRVGDPGCRG